MIVMRGNAVEIMSSLQEKAIEFAIEEIKGRGDGMKGIYQRSDQVGVPTLVGNMAEEQGGWHEFLPPLFMVYVLVLKGLVEHSL